MARTVCSIGSEYLPASFNGVAFFCTEASSEHGRRGSEAEYPFGENTNYADLGRKIRTYTLSASFRDDNHVMQAAALIAVCEAPGPGILVHPTRGIISAACRSIKVSDNIEQEAGITNVDLEFVEANVFPNGLSLIGSILGLVVGTVINTSSDSFKVRYQPKKVTPSRRTVVVDTAQEAVGIVADTYALSIQNQKNDKKWRGYSDLKEIQYENTLASDPVTVDQALVLGTNAINIELAKEVKFNTFRDFANWAAQLVTMPGLAGESEDAVYSHVRILSAAYMAQAAIEIQYAKTHEVLAALDAITNILDDEIVAARGRCENVLHLELSKFRTEVQTVLFDKAYRLPRLVRYDFHGAVHPLVASYAIYNDAKRHRELELRNIVDANGRIGPHVVAGTLAVQ